MDTRLPAAELPAAPAGRRAPALPRPSRDQYIFTPHVMEQEGQGLYSFDIWSRLLKDRIILLGTPIVDDVANILVAQFLYLQSVDPAKDIQFYVNCPGGSVTAGLAIYDTMQMVTCDVCTYCIGQAASMGAVLLAAGTKGKRFALPHARLMLHQPWGGLEGTAIDIGIQAREIIRQRAAMNQIMAQHTGQELKKIETDTDRDFFMSAEEAKSYGLVDAVLTRPPKRPNP